MKATAKTLLTLTTLAAASALGILMGQAAAPTMPIGGATGTPQEIARKMGMRNVGVHDPSTIVKCGDEYYIYATGMNMFHSKDLFTWTAGRSPITGPLAWTQQAVGRTVNGGNGYWAPDVIKVKDKYLLYLSISSFGVNTSGIGVLSSPTLDPAAPDYKWTDGGMVVQSRTNDDFNCIDPAAIYDDGKLWVAFGSFWSGIKLIACNPDTGARLPDTPMYSLAHWDAIEGCYIYKHDTHYYLFVSLGMCCRQARSTYNMRVGRADKITGPYTDKDGKDMLLGGGTPFMESHIGPLIGPGHAGIITKDDKYYISFHVESNSSGNGPNGGTLGVRPITWDEKGWPVPLDAE